MSLPVEREIATVAEDLRKYRARKGEGDAEMARILERRLAELQDEAEVERISREVVESAARLHNEQMEERRRQEAQP